MLESAIEEARAIIGLDSRTVVMPPTLAQSCKNLSLSLIGFSSLEKHHATVAGTRTTKKANPRINLMPAPRFSCNTCCCCCCCYFCYFCCCQHCRWLRMAMVAGGRFVNISFSSHFSHQRPHSVFITHSRVQVETVVYDDLSKISRPLSRCSRHKDRAERNIRSKRI